VVVRQLSRIRGVIANALHDEDLGCRKLSHVDEVATNLIWGISACPIQKLGVRASGQGQSTCTKERNRVKAHLNSDPLEVRGQVVLDALWLQGLQLWYIWILGGAQKGTRDGDLRSRQDALLLLLGAVAAAGGGGPFCDFQLATEGVDAADVVGCSRVRSHFSGGRMAKEEVEGIGSAVQGISL
jgi:hypothetical protein